MKKNIIITFIFCLIYVSTYAQIKLKTYSKKIEKGYEYLADNNEYCPISVKVDFTLSNMKSFEGNHKIFVVPARTKGFLISKITYIKRARYSYRAKTKFNYGNYFNTKTNNNYIYNLPFEKNKFFKISQGYNGSISHQNENALDFSMPIGTNIYAAREGTVIKVVEKNTKTCPRRECIKFNNLILMYHSDGTFSEYAHLKKDGALVTVGEKVKKGQLIAKSGNVGFSTGPHLHFAVFNQKIEKRVTLKTKFRVGEKGIFLKEKEKYRRNYN